MPLPTEQEIAEFISQNWEKLRADRNISRVDDSLTKAAAGGLVKLAWRNSPVENMHASKRGPSDGEMWAESVALNRVAQRLIATGNPTFVYKFEDHLLDRQRRWAGGKTLREIGYGNLGDFTRHVKSTTDAFSDFEDNYGWEVFLGRLAWAADDRHWAMPRWPKITQLVRHLVENPDDPAWLGDGKEALKGVPSSMPDPETLESILLRSPDELPIDILQWLISQGVMMAASSDRRTQ